MALVRVEKSVGEMDVPKVGLTVQQLVSSKVERMVQLMADLMDKNSV